MFFILYVFAAFLALGQTAAAAKKWGRVQGHMTIGQDTNIPIIWSAEKPNRVLPSPSGYGFIRSPAMYYDLGSAAGHVCSVYTNATGEIDQVFIRYKSLNDGSKHRWIGQTPDITLYPDPVKVAAGAITVAALAGFITWLTLYLKKKKRAKLRALQNARNAATNQ